MTQPTFVPQGRAPARTGKKHDMNIKLILSGAACAALLVACNQQQAGEAVDKTQDMASAPVGQTSAATMGGNMVSAYVPNAAMGDMYEIQAADVAAERSTNADVKMLAEMIKADHTAASTKFKALVPTAAPDVALPTVLDERRQGLVDNLKSAPAANFDKVYLDQQEAAHTEALSLMQGYAENGGDAGLKAAAGEIAPHVQEHLDKVKSIKAAMK